MENALKRVKKGLTNKLGVLGGKKGAPGNKDVLNSVDSLDSFVSSAHNNTIHVVSEINQGFNY